jgi:Peroxiredoxin
MKKILCFALTLLLAACGPRVAETTIIHGRAEGGTAERASIYVWDYELNEPIELADGGFTYELPTNKAVVATLTCRIDGKDVLQPLIPDGSELTVIFRPDGAELRSSNRKSLNYELVELNKKDKQITAKIRARQAAQNAGATQEVLDSLYQQIQEDMRALHQEYRENIEQHKDDYLGVEGLSRLRGMLTDEQIDSLICTLDSTAIRTIRIQTMRNDIQGRLRTKEGKPFVDFSYEFEGKTLRLSDYVGKGKYVLADFWASWCQPCIAELPHLKEVYRQFNGPEFTILGITVSDDPADSRTAIREHALPWDQLIGSNMLAAETYGVDAIPHLILFGPDGTILRRDLHGSELATILSEILAK